ncbi:MAG: hypothetical protein GXO65_07260 [Euryarchaeota archaeon]|nr:hypothetical protein [Euryarchaeota archaeon]
MINPTGVELGLLALESVLLIFTLILLIFSIREGRQRDRLIREVAKATKILTRHEYFLNLVDIMMESEEEVLGWITGRMPTGEDEKRTREIIENIKRLVRRGVRVRYIMPKFPDRLHVGWLYTKAGAEVRYGTCSRAGDFRYTVVDGRLSIIGIPEVIGEKEATKKGYFIPSEGLSALLKSNFAACWQRSITYEDFVRETLAETGATPKTLAQEINIDPADLERIL